VLVIIDIQNDYFEGGAFPLPGADSAVANAATLVAAARSSGVQVIHIRHVWDAPDATFMVPGTPGAEIHDAVAPAAGETVVSKHFPNAFRHTTLGDTLRRLGATDLVVAGMMSNLCVDATVRAAADHGYTVTVAHDACASSDLEFGVAVPAASVHAAFMAGLTEYGEVLSSAEIVAEHLAG
jgi:nicotinamidase-related amidase